MAKLFKPIAQILVTTTENVGLQNAQKVKSEQVSALFV